MFKRFYSLLIISFIVLSCSEESNPKFDTENFTSIFDNYKFSIAYTPIDMVQTSDGGYLILGSRKLPNSNFSGIYLLKADENGDFVKELEVDDTYVNPVAHFTQIGEVYYFFCMEEDPSLIANLASVDANLENVTFTPVASPDADINPTYPSVSSFIDNSFLLQCYDHLNKQTALFTVDPTSGSASKAKAFTIGIGATENIEKSIINSFTRGHRSFPYEVGKSGSTYFFSGFYNFTFCLVFTDLSSDEPSGVVYGQNPPEPDFDYAFSAGFSSVVNLSGEKFAVSTFYFGENYINPIATISTNSISSMRPDELGGYSFPELIKNANIRILRSTINTKNVLIYGSDTKTKQIGLYFYDELTGEFLGSRYLGFSNPFEIASVINTDDEGIAVSGTTYVAGRFPRICIFKLSKEEIAGEIK
jgi:hypothetical protein